MSFIKIIRIKKLCLTEFFDKDIKRNYADCCNNNCCYCFVNLLLAQVLITREYWCCLLSLYLWLVLSLQLISQTK